MEEKVILKLTEWEVANFHLPPVATVTFYEGKASIAFLRKRLANVLKKNPWITSRIAKKNIPGGKAVMTYENAFDAENVIDQHFSVYEAGEVGDNVVIETEEKSETRSRVKYEKSSLREDQAQEYYEKLISHVKVEKPFLESKFTLPQLADQLELNPNYISQVINEKLNQNFYDFVNKYRIEEFKRRLKIKTASNYTLLAHGLESGFSSKSSFYEVFKKFTGQTPSEYNRELAS